MLMSKESRLEEALRGLADKYGRKRSSLLAILQEMQQQQMHISPHAMQVVADLLGIHPVEVHSVVSFYSFFGEKPLGQFVLRLCQTVSCDMENKSLIARQLENELGIKFGDTTPDKKFTLCYTNCIGMCDQGPAMMVNDEVYTMLTPEKVHSILENCRKSFGVHATESLRGARS